MKTKQHTLTLEQFKDKHFGKSGAKRQALEDGYKDFALGALVLEARKAKGLTQSQLAEKVGTTKSYISKIENNIKEVRLSTLQKIVEEGLGGKLEITVTL